jgi:hypothetical protein
MRRSTYAARSAGLIRSEELENRRLFAGMPFGRGDSGHGDFGHHFAGGPPAWADAIVVGLPLGGFMRVSSEANSTTAYSSNYSINSTSMSGQSASAAVRTTSAPRSPEAVPVTVQNPPPTPAAEAPVVQQVMPDTTTDTSAAHAARSAAATLSFDTASEPVFGPFKLGTVQGDSNPSARTSNTGSLLTIDPDAVDRSLRWQSQDATYRPRRPASPTTTSEEVSLELAARAAMHVQQATLSPVPVELAGRPLCQRLATVAAAGLLVVTNTIVRRRQRRAAKVVAR